MPAHVQGPVLIFMTTYVSHITHPEALAGIAPLGAESACTCACLQGQHDAICKVPGTSNGLLGNAWCNGCILHIRYGVRHSNILTV